MTSSKDDNQLLPQATMAQKGNGRRTEINSQLNQSWAISRSTTRALIPNPSNLLPRSKMSPLKSFFVGTIFGAVISGTIAALCILSKKKATGQEGQREFKKVPIEHDEGF